MTVKVKQLGEKWAVYVNGEQRPYRTFKELHLAIQCNNQLMVQLGIAEDETEEEEHYECDYCHYDSDSRDEFVFDLREIGEILCQGCEGKLQTETRHYEEQLKNNYWATRL